MGVDLDSALTFSGLTPTPTCRRALDFVGMGPMLSKKEFWRISAQH